jgi:hypothetical protein
MTEVRVVDAPTTELDGLVTWFEDMADGLVLLEPYPLVTVRGAVTAVTAGIGRHLDEPLAMAGGTTREVREWNHLAQILDRDHAWFRTSLEQLAWFLEVVEREDHGGHRQAIGQYGRLLCESFRRHRELERLLATPRGEPTRPGPSRQI